MKSPARVAVGVLLAALATANLQADATWVYAVQISARTQTAPPQITLQWEPDPYGANSYTLYRKAKDATSWGGGTTLPGSAANFVDNNVAVGATYEYAIVKSGSQGYTGYGYIYSGINADLVDSRGTVVLVVDNTYAGQLAAELSRLQSDLAGDGWTVVRRDISRNDSPASVRSTIQAVYSADPGNVKAVFLFGHVPILRSGNLNVDGHQARPMPADAFYGDMDGNWDNPSFLPSDVELMVGRVDLFDLPGNGAPAPWPSELELLRNYLNKDHNWRFKQISVPQRALVGNRFGDFGGEAFAASGFRNFEPFVGSGNIVLANEQDSAPPEQKWSSMLSAGSYLWAYGCGGGSYTSMSGMGTHGAYGDVWSSDLVNGNAKAVFFMMFGSWLGEWDSTDNIMRSALATPSMGLTCSWAGRPHWYYHHMALGEPIGYCARLTQNNNGLYQNQVNQNLRGIHIALMGDPTLRAHPVAAPASVNVSTSSGGANVSWGAAPDSVVGYHVYRAASGAGPFTRLTGSPIAGGSFNDSGGSASFTYMVRAIKLEVTPSGTYYNASQGTFANSGGTPPPPPPPPGNPSGSVVMTAPANGATVSGGSVIVSANVNVANLAGVQFKLDGANLGPELKSGPYSISWDSKLSSNGSHPLGIVARDSSGGQISSPQITVTVNNSSTPAPPPSTPSGSVVLTAPANGATVSGGSVIVSANVNVANLAGVQFKLDGANLGPELKSGPYSISWDSKLSSNGSHPLGIVARDSSGGQISSPQITVIVNNSSTPAPPPSTPSGSVVLTAPANGATVSGGSVLVSANVTIANLAGVQFKLDSANLGPELKSPPYAVSWDSKLTNDGPHQLSAVARDAVGARVSSPVINVTVNNSSPVAPAANALYWVDDALPAGAVAGADGGDAWIWVSSNPAPFSGTHANQSSLAAGPHQHYFDWASSTLAVNAGEVLFAYIYLDPNNPPSEAMLQWNDGTWEHRAYWGANNLLYGVDGTSGRFYAGLLPAPGQWARLEVRASQVGLEGRNIRGMAFSLYNGRATWDAAGKSATPTVPVPPADTTPPTVSITAPVNNATIIGASFTVSANASDNVRVAGVQFKLDGANFGPEDISPPYTITLNTSALSSGAHYLTAVARDAASNRATSPVVTVNVSKNSGSPNDTVWFDDSLPQGAVAGADGGDSWNWVASNPTPFSGSACHISSISAGSHQHYFRFASARLPVNSGDALVAYVYLDPANPPSEIMLQWNDGSWEHRAYWGANTLTYGTDGTPSRYSMGALPALGQWVRLEIPARLVGLEGSSLEGMAFSLFGGRAAWDRAGKRSP